jgi:ribonuclease G
MAKNILVISCETAETRVALIENGIIAELHIERRGSQPRGGTVGDIYLGKVTRVLPGLQAAFVDIGLERAAFLHVEDLIRPDDFEAYLAGGRKHALGTENGSGAHDATSDGAVAAPDEPVVGETPTDADEVGADDTAGIEEEVAEDADDEPSESMTSQEPGNDLTDPPEVDESSHEVDPFPDDNDQDSLDDSASEGEDAAAVHPPAAAAPSANMMAGAGSRPAPVDLDPLDDLLDDPDLPGFTVSDPGVPPPLPSAAPLGGRGERGGGSDRRRRRRGKDRGRNARPEPRQETRTEHRPRPGATPGRLSKSTPIREVVKEGQEIIVQITKEPIGTKGARCSSHISLPGRYVVYLPTLDHVGISKRIGNDKERARLREAIDSMKPPTGGLIVRTVAEGLTKKQLKQDVGYLVRLWGEVANNREGAKAPKTLCSELDIVLKTARDLFTDDVDQMVIDDKAQYDRLHRFVEMFMPDRAKDIVFFNEDEPIFDAYGIEDEIARALSRKVPLPSGGYLIIDEAEALTAIDVNTGRFVGKGSKDMEETILKTNLEAVQEIAYQLRFRNIGGLIILDLIDMERLANREKVRKTLEALLQRDKAKTTLNRISELGLIEMTRKRTRESLGRLLHEPCFYCDGTGHLQSKETVAYEILREIRRKRNDLPGYTVIVNCHPAVADLLTGSEKAIVHEAETRYMRRIQVNSRTEYHIEQFDLTGK